MEVINNHITKIKLLCQKQRVKQLFVFGSVLTPRFNDSSDVDMVVEFLPMDPLEYADFYFNLKFGLEELLSRKVDLLEIQAIKNPIFREVVEQNKRLIYDKGSAELVA